MNPLLKTLNLTGKNVNFAIKIVIAFYSTFPHCTVLYVSNTVDLTKFLRKNRGSKIMQFPQCVQSIRIQIWKAWCFHFHEKFVKSTAWWFSSFSFRMCARVHFCAKFVKLTYFGQCLQAFLPFSQEISLPLICNFSRAKIKLIVKYLDHSNDVFNFEGKVI